VGARRYTDQQFLDAVADPDVRTVADLCRALGIAPRGGNYESVRQRAERLGIELRTTLGERTRPTRPAPPRTRRTWTDEQLLAALTDPAVCGYRELCDRLDLGRWRKNYRNVRARAEELGVPLPAEWSIAGTRPGAHPRTGSRIDAEELATALRGAKTRKQVLQRLGLPASASNYARLQRSLDEHQLCAAHLSANGNRRRPIEEDLVQGRIVTGLRRRLIEEGLRMHRCERCGRTEWEGRPIPLELDHIDGDRTNNLLENLRLLCPNCHALTPTYRGRNIGRRPGPP
jgi:hypothetical protein